MGRQIPWVALCVVVMCGSAMADWEVGDPFKMHFPQLPDLDCGMNVLATRPKILADDWKCSATGPVTDIHFWGSWLNDQIPPQGLIAGLYIFADIPQGPGVPYSHPGPLLWQGIFQGLVGDTIQHTEPFFDPNINQIIGIDTQVIQYNFFIPLDCAFVQQLNTIYWLGVTRMGVDNDSYRFGWKSSKDHFNDDAVYGDFPPTGGLPTEWLELIDPRSGTSMDLSFVITTIPEPTTMALVGTAVAGLLGIRRRRRMR